MAKTLQHRRGTTTELASVTGAIGEIFMDTTKKTLVVMDGTTVGGTPLAVEGSGGSGSSYDQSLNTTDGVVFDSALIGDVSIIANTIAGVDSYGNSTALVVSSDLSVKSTQVSVSDFTLTPSNWGSMSALYGGSAQQVFINTSGYYGNYPETATLLQTLSVGDALTINLNSGYGSYNVIIASISYSEPGGGYTITWANSPVPTSGIQYVSSLIFTTTVSTEITPLSVTETGINVNGALTVNGLPLPTAGSSYDQSLNTTDDVVFNSALVGNVSVIGNTVSGVDTYGNVNTLVLSSPVDFNYTEAINSLTSINTGTEVLVKTYDWMTYQGGFTQYASNLSSTVQQQLLNIPTGTLVTTDTRFDPGTYQSLIVRFIVNTITPYYDPYNPSAVYSIAYTYTGTPEYSTDGGTTWQQLGYNGANYTSQSGQGTLNYGSVTTTENTAVSVTSTGLTIDGNLEVTGTLQLPVTPDVPVTPGTVVTWAKITVGGQVYFTPLYQ